MALHEVHWEVTNKCNLRCKHCLPDSGSARDRELTTSEAMTALESFRAAGVSRVNFTGGEPFSRKDFLSILERTVALGMRAAVITNVTLLQELELETIKRLGVELGVSLDGADEMTNAVIRGQGSFEKVIEVLKQCQEAGVPTTLYVTVTAVNLHQVDALAALAKTQACRGIHYSEVTLAGRAISFSDELALSAEQKAALPRQVAQAASDVFGEQVSTMDERCFVDSATLYMAANGGLYVCSEVFQRRSDLSIGNIRSFSFQAWLDEKITTHVGYGHPCCYGMFASPHVVFVGNIGPDCAFVPKQCIETLAELYSALGNLYRGIEHDCHECKHPDCMGYIWLLNEEVSRLYERGVPLVQINNGPTFIHSFPAKEHDEPDLSVRYPSCSQLCTDSRRCKIHNDRPLVCHLYPVGPETKADGTIVWALHRDCLHVEKMEARGELSQFNHRVCNIFNSLSPRLLGEIAEAYRTVDAISAFPDGANRYFVLQEISYVEVQGSP